MSAEALAPLSAPPEGRRLRSGVRRLGEGVLVLLGVSLMTFLLVSAAPRDVATAIVLRQTGDASPALVARERHKLGLDRPLIERYADDLGRVVRGDLGVSERTGRPVADELAERLPATLELAGGHA